MCSSFVLLNIVSRLLESEPAAGHDTAGESATGWQWAGKAVSKLQRGKRVREAGDLTANVCLTRAFPGERYFFWFSQTFLFDALQRISGGRAGN